MIYGAGEMIVVFGGGAVGMRGYRMLPNRAVSLGLYRHYDKNGTPLKKAPKKPEMAVHLAFTNPESLDILVTNLLALKQFFDSPKESEEMKKLAQEITIELEKISKKPPKLKKKSRKKKKKVRR